jgi:hypothetical protein
MLLIGEGPKKYIKGFSNNLKRDFAHVANIANFIDGISRTEIMCI